MDTFFEQIVKKKKSALEWFIVVGTPLAAAVLLFGLLRVPALMSIPILSTAIIVAIGYGGWWLMTSQNIELEYCVTNGDIDIDLIIAKRKRKRIVSVRGRKIESLVPVTAPIDKKAYRRVVVAAPSERDDGLWAFTYHSKKNGHTLVLFQPESRVLKALVDGLTGPVKNDTRAAMMQQGILFE